MKFDELLKEAWLAESRPPSPPQDLTRRARRQQYGHRLQRAAEVALTLVAVLLFGQALVSERIDPSHWLLMPFFVVFLPIAWAIVLRAPRRHLRDASERASTYARLRLSQLRTGLRDLWLARATAWALLAYALAANVVAWLLAGPDWHNAGLFLLASAVVWFGATLWLSGRLRRQWLREYRAVRRLVSG
ncbi:MAG: hypothetical protein A3E01_01590 [Gammaproteobacteria bacterium RIFCSPHIGHO2_12_FULL_63_22]|nr:MAG: hypothetical protein A3E01_01590 [Gammaproteobacteria bacterium RIFCSPHIGHO2_12_FULL_63_22]